MNSSPSHLSVLGATHYGTVAVQIMGANDNSGMTAKHPEARMSFAKMKIAQKLWSCLQILVLYRSLGSANSGPCHIGTF